jgi:hypothetical protein
MDGGRDGQDLRRYRKDLVGLADLTEETGNTPGFILLWSKQALEGLEQTFSKETHRQEKVLQREILEKEDWIRKLESVVSELSTENLTLKKLGVLSPVRIPQTGEDKRPEEDGNRLPPGLARKAEWQARIRKCLDGLEAKAREAEQEKEEKKQAWAERETAEGPLRGRKPRETPPDPESPKANLTDPENRIMISRREGYVQAYHAQIVESEEQIIWSQDHSGGERHESDVSHAGSDKGRVGPGGNRRSSSGGSGRQGLLEQGVHIAVDPKNRNSLSPPSGRSGA